MKKIKLSIFFLSIFSLVSCNFDVTTDSVFVTFKNYDDTVLYVTEIPYGSKVTYNGEEPVKEDNDYIYDFIGWDKNIDENIYENTTFIAQFDICGYEKYLVTFLNDDGSILQESYFRLNSYAKYNLDTPTKKSNDSHLVYKFIGWDKDPKKVPILHDTIFVAKYKLAFYWNVNFYNYDGSLLLTQNVEHNYCTFYSGRTPKKPSDDEHFEYTFKDWGVDLNSYKITKDEDFYAQYTITEYVFAKFYSYDDKLLLTKKIKKYGDANYDGETPTKPYNGSGYKYKFRSWDKRLSNLATDTDFYPLFDLVAIHIVKFVNYDNSLLYSTEVEHGNKAIYNGYTPVRPSVTSGDYKYVYTFSGWDKSLSNITSDTTFMAQFKVETYVSGKTEIINYLNTYGKGEYNNVETEIASEYVTTLGYKSNYFYLGYVLNSSPLQAYMAISFSYLATYGSARFEVYDSGILMFDATYTLKFSNHKLVDISVNTIYKNIYPSSAQEDLASLTVGAANLTCTNCTLFLEKKGLDYIF